MERLTSDKPQKNMGMFELVHNDVFVQKGEAWYTDRSTTESCRNVVRWIFSERGIDPCREFFTDDDFFDEYMIDLLQYGFESIKGIIAILYVQLWSKCDLRETLKKYEDTGLTPEDIKKLDKMYIEKCKEVNDLKRQLQGMGESSKILPDGSGSSLLDNRK